MYNEYPRNIAPKDFDDLDRRSFYERVETREDMDGYNHFNNSVYPNVTSNVEYFDNNMNYQNRATGNNNFNYSNYGTNTTPGNFNYPNSNGTYAYDDERFYFAPFLLGGLAGGALGYGIANNNNQGNNNGYYYPVYPMYPVFPTYTNTNYYY